MKTSYPIILKNYKEWLHTLGFATSTVYDYPLFVKHFFTYLTKKNIHQINLITTKIVVDYFTYLEQKTGERTGQTFSTSHLNRNFLAIDKLLEFLHQMNVSNTPPPIKYSLQNHRKKPLQILTKQEVKALYEAVPLTFNEFTFAKREARQMAVKLVLDLCYGCGLRKTEALNLKMIDIHFNKQIIHVKQGKNYKDRYVPINEKLIKSIENFRYNYRRELNTKRAACLPNRQEYLYPFGTNAIADALRLLLQQTSNTTLKNKKPTLHTLRHSIATHLLQNGMSIENIALFLGHSTLESTKLYTHFLKNDE